MQTTDNHLIFTERCAKSKIFKGLIRKFHVQFHFVFLFDCILSPILNLSSLLLNFRPLLNPSSPLSPLHRFSPPRLSIPCQTQKNPKPVTVTHFRFFRWEKSLFPIHSVLCPIKSTRSPPSIPPTNHCQRKRRKRRQRRLKPR